MKIQLAMAVALHALALGAGARWARPRPAPVWAPAPDGLEIAVGAPDPSPSAPESPPPPDPPGEPASAGGGPARHEAPGPAEPSGARAHEADPMVEPDDRLRAWQALVSPASGASPAGTEEAPPPAELAGEARTGSGKGRGASSGGDGEGNGGKGRRRRRRIHGERWDSAAGPLSEEPPDDAAEADEHSVPRHAVEDAVGRSAGRLRLCYQDGVRREPGLAGLIPVRFSVDQGGTVLVASDAGATVADPAVVRCVLAAFAAMTFPARRHGDAVWALYVVAFPPE